MVLYVDWQKLLARIEGAATIPSTCCHIDNARSAKRPRLQHRIEQEHT